ncbi:tetratricopeptide repeat protein [Cerasicoccus arenae]|uniref:Tetratricopeptide repeat protein n=1 Tax=Cerasicoccus arenae TaxID=424488 RepID=A0A8J3DEU0_9BACT|nr:tetratricopeptide repeat protein [Cerasicoccus arenae]MBK1859964.1 tetratricopeptide repeat protein [Cerasicoccus arenae]GHC12666.1 hypothetical protein GCM10007047_32560 [Cerasicoccus arenae]
MAKFGPLLLLGWLLLIATARGALTDMPPTMQETLQIGVTAFTHAEYDKAAQAFDHLAEQFGEESQYLPLAPTLLPIHGYACQMSDRPSDAITHYQAFLGLPNQLPSRRAFVLFSLAQAYQQNGDFDKAVATYQSFIEAAPDSPEAVLSAMRQAELHFEKGDDQAGIDRLIGFAASDRVPPSLGAQAQLRALQKALELDDYPQAQTILFGYEWRVEAMPELAVLTFAALEVGNRLLDDGQYLDAIRAYRLVTPASQLIAAQNARLQGLQITWNDQQQSAGQGYHAEAIWNDYYRDLMERVQAQLLSLHTSEDFTPSFQMRLGQAFLLANRPHEAYIVFRMLAADESLNGTLRGSAHYRWILAANSLDDWDESLRIARLFLERYPDHPEAPGTMYLIANAYQEKKEFRQAVTILTELLDQFPEHQLATRWRFIRGYNSVLAQDYPSARIDFQTCLQANPDPILAAQIRLWDAMSHFFERNYPEALRRFDASIEATHKDNPLYPEMVYRRAQTLYSARDYAAALVATDDFLQRHSDHLRAPEARVLRGDVLMGEGRLLEASNQFARVTPKAGPLFAYAVFQRGKIQKAMEAYDLMIEHFTGYVRREDVPDKVRIAEALYWIGWAYQQQEEPARAFPLFIEALAVHGNDVKAGETIAILQALHKLHGQYRSGELSLSSVVLDPFGLLTTPDFEEWLEGQYAQAYEAEQWTWLSRINLYRAMLYRQRKDDIREGDALLEIVNRVPLERLDPEGLATAGNLLVDLEISSADEYFDYLIEEYPRSMQLGAAYYGRARLALIKDKPAEAEAWLNRFEAETSYHPAGPQVKLLRGQLLVQLGQPEQAVAVLQQLLRLKSARGRPHAQALLGIAQAYELAGQPDKAIAHYQRIYTLYRAYPDEVVQAYIASAPLFEARGDLRAAYNTWAELQRDPRLDRFTEAKKQASEAIARLELLLPAEPDALTADLPSSKETEGPL